MSPVVFALLECMMLIGAGAGFAFGWGWVEGGYTEPMKRRLRWAGGFCAVWAVVVGLLGAGIDGPLMGGFVGLCFLGLVGFSTSRGPSSAQIVRSAGIVGNLILLFNGLVFSAVLAGLLDYVGLHVEFGSWAMYGLVPVGWFVALRVHGLRVMAHTPVG